MGERRKISLVVADVDGTLVTEQKVGHPGEQGSVSNMDFDAELKRLFN